MFTGRLDRNEKIKTVALAEYQIAVLRLLSERRKREGVSYIAGGGILPAEKIGACVLNKRTTARCSTREASAGLGQKSPDWPLKSGRNGCCSHCASTTVGAMKMVQNDDFWPHALTERL